MFTLLFFISLIASLVSFCIMCVNFTSYYTLFISCFITMIVSWKLVKIEEKVEKNKEDIKQIKQHCGIDDATQDNKENE